MDRAKTESVVLPAPRTLGGVDGINSVYFLRDGRSYAMSYVQALSQLYLLRVLR